MLTLIKFIIDGTPYALKGACTVWTRGKGRDNFKVLPIGIACSGICRSVLSDGLFEILLSGRVYGCADDICY